MIEIFKFKKLFYYILINFKILPKISYYNLNITP